MTGALLPPGGRPLLLRLTPQATGVFLLAGAAWAVTIGQAVRMGNGPGTMGLGMAEFFGMWTLMMAAMMLPSVAPMASLYSRTVQSARAWRLATFTAGYLIVWAAAGLPAYALLRASGALAPAHPTVARASAAGLLAVAGGWQLSGAKDRCLAHCRSPISVLLRYASYRGILRDLKASIHHASFCLGCCWMLMALFAVFGVMNIAAMIVLALIVLLEKLWSHGTGFSRAVGVTSLILALAALFAPSLTPGLHQHAPMHM